MTSPKLETLAVDPTEERRPHSPAAFVLHDPEIHVEINRLSVDEDEAIADIDIPGSETASIASSLFEHVEENGRTYHKYKEGKYVLPNDEMEQDRLVLQHHLTKIALHGRLHLAPIKEENLKHILDFGTGTGSWAIEMADKYPGAQVIGSDLSPIQPDFIPPNLAFEIDDIENEWIYPHPFSYIHGRFMAIAFHGNPTPIFQKAFDSLEPGGYFEMQDISGPMQCIDGSYAGSAIQKASQMMEKVMKPRGIDMTVPSRYKAIFESVGFVDVKEVVIEWPVGTWAKSKYHKLIGAWYQKDLVQGVDGMTMALFTRDLGLKREDVTELMGQVKRDMMDRRIHTYQNFYVVYGRKPL